jgi:hypothetical protein
LADARPLEAHQRAADWPGSKKEVVVSRDECQHPLGRGDSARIKGAIDAGRTRDKVPGFDPGAAPLGTDEESAGASLSQDFGPRTSAEPAAAAAAADPKGNDRSAYRAQDRMVWPVILGLTLTIAAAALGVILLY